MIVLERVELVYERRIPTLRVRCEGCGDVYVISSWPHNVTPERRCHACCDNASRRPRAARLTSGACGEGLSDTAHEKKTEVGM